MGVSLVCLFYFFLVCYLFFCPSRTEGTSAAVDDIVMCARKADEGVLIDRGYEKLQPQLKAVGLGKVTPSTTIVADLPRLMFFPTTQYRLDYRRLCVCNLFGSMLRLSECSWGCAFLFSQGRLDAS